MKTYKRPKTVIKHILKLYEDESRWTQHTNARTKEGIPCRISDPEAYSFCINGAIWLFVGPAIPNSHTLYSKVYSLLSKESLCRSAISTNDDFCCSREQAYQNTMDMLRKALK